jgi:mannose-6-phosphate isomerase-like protein (cupin superfamily)
MRAVSIPHPSGGEGAVSAKMHMDAVNIIMMSELLPGTSIGMHSHNNRSEINFVITGKGRAICDVEAEIFTAGVCQNCTKGSSHSIINNGTEPLVLFTVVPAQ